MKTALLVGSFLSVIGSTVSLYAGSRPGDRVCTPCMQATIRFLASDAMQGRGSTTEFERISAEYAASELRRLNIAPAFADGSYVQEVPLTFLAFTAPPVLSFRDVHWSAGEQFVVRRMSQPVVKAKLRRILVRPDVPPEVNFDPDTAVLLKLPPATPAELQTLITPYLQSSAAAVIVEAFGSLLQNWKALAAAETELPIQLGNEDSVQPGPGAFPVIVRPPFFKQLAALPDGTVLNLSGDIRRTSKTTWNVSGVLPAEGDASPAVMFSAHLDHLGRDEHGQGDTIFNGADDDASGVAAVLELARILASGDHPHSRPVVFTLFGGEELGLLGSRYYAENTTLLRGNIAAVVNFEQLGHPDEGAARDQFWMTGWERSDLGQVLASRGARLIADPHTDQHFFRGADNFSFFRHGVVAHTISGSGHFPEYHKPSDDVTHIDFDRMQRGFESVIDSLLWLTGADYSPRFTHTAGDE